MNYGLILAAGTSARFGSSKIFAPLWGRPVIEYSLLLLETSPEIDEVFVACSSVDYEHVYQLCTDTFTKPFEVHTGGATRFDSVRILSEEVSNAHTLGSDDTFVVMNAANPFATNSEIVACLHALKKNYMGVGVAREVTSSLKKCSTSRLRKKVVSIESHIDRAFYVAMETPQVVRATAFCKAVNKAKKDKKHQASLTDELAVLGYAGFETATVAASDYNRKITFGADLDMMNSLVTSIGIGEDSHAYISGSKKPLILGGISIEANRYFDADSDGDVVLHAIANALSSAIGGGSLGMYATAMCEDGITDSREYVKAMLKRVRGDDDFAHVAHVAISIEGMYPKIDSLAPRMRESLSSLLDMPISRIGITATTGKSHSAYGRGKALKVTATLILKR